MKLLILTALCLSFTTISAAAQEGASWTNASLVDMSEVRESVQCDGRRFAILPVSDDSPERAEIFAIVDSSQITTADHAMLVSREVAERMASEQCIFAGSLASDAGTGTG